MSSFYKPVILLCQINYRGLTQTVELSKFCLPMCVDCLLPQLTSSLQDEAKLKSKKGLCLPRFIGEGGSSQRGSLQNNEVTWSMNCLVVGNCANTEVKRAAHADGSWIMVGLACPRP